MLKPHDPDDTHKNPATLLDALSKQRYIHLGDPKRVAACTQHLGAADIQILMPSKDTLHCTYYREAHTFLQQTLKSGRMP